MTAHRCAIPEDAMWIIAPRPNITIAVYREGWIRAGVKEDNIYVIVEIEGYLYLTKGATFSYHEFSMPQGKELKDFVPDL